LLGGFFILAAGCVNIENAAPSVGRIPNAAHNTAVLEHGREIYLGKCTSCHSAQTISKFSATEWPGIVNEMGHKAKLAPAEEQVLLTYVLAARPVPPVKN